MTRISKAGGPPSPLAAQSVAEAPATVALHDQIDVARVESAGPLLMPSGSPVDLASAERVFILHPSTSQQRDQVMERLASALARGEVITARFREPGAATVGPVMQVGALEETEDGVPTLAVKDPLKPDAPWQPMRYGAFFSSATEVSFSATLPTQEQRPIVLPDPVDVDALTSEQRTRLATNWVEWVKAQGVLSVHEKWHNRHGPGGSPGAGSGEVFLQFHGQLLEDFKQHLKTTGQGDLLEAAGGDLPLWDTKKPIPQEYEYAGMASKSIDWEIPSWLTHRGTQPTPQFNGPTVSKLGDFQTPDQLGHAIGFSVHSIGHSGLGGPMETYHSVTVPPFMLWHAVLERIRREWLTTENGQAWLKAHPSGWSNPKAAEH